MADVQILPAGLRPAAPSEESAMLGRDQGPFHCAARSGKAFVSDLAQPKLEGFDVTARSKAAAQWRFAQTVVGPSHFAKERSRVLRVGSEC